MSQLPSKKPPEIPMATPASLQAAMDRYRDSTDRFKWHVGMVVQGLLGLGVLAILVALAWVGSALADDILDSFSRTAASRFLDSPFASWLGGYVGSLVRLLAWGGALTAVWLVLLDLAVEAPADRARFRGKGLAGIWGILVAQAIVTEILRVFVGWPVEGIQELTPLFVPVVVALVAAAAYVLFRTKVVPLAWQELKVLLLRPMGYGLMAVMLLVMGKVLADTMADLQSLDPYSETAIAPLRLVFSHWGIPIVFLLLGPLATMGLVSEERNRGTFEGLMTLPAREWHIALGKLLGCFTAVAVMWTTVLFYMYFLGLFGTLDAGQVATSFLVVYLLLMMLVSIGLFCSSLFRSQLAAAVLSVVLVASMMWATELPSFFGAAAQSTGALAAAPSAALSYFDGQTHLTWAARGTIDSRTIAYLLSMTALFVFLSVHSLKAARTGALDLKRYASAVVKVALLVLWLLLAAGAVVVLIWGMAWLLTDAPEAMKANSDLYFLAMLLLTIGNVAAFFLGAPRLLTAKGSAPPLAMAGFAVLLGGSVAFGVLTVLGMMPLQLALALQPAVLAVGLAMMWLDPSDAAGKRIRWSANIVTGALAIVAIAVGFNFLSYWYHDHVDLSAGHAFSLDPEAKAVFNQTVQRGEVVQVLSLISYTPPKTGETLNPADAQNNSRYEILKLYLDNLDKAINKPGNVKFEYKFLDKGSTEYQDVRNKYPIRRDQDLILLYRDRSGIIPDAELFRVDYNDEAIQTYLDELNRKKKRREISGNIPTLDEIKDSVKPENLPPEYQTIRPMVDDKSRVVIEKRVLEEAIRLVKNAFVNVWVTEGSGERRFLRTQAGSGDHTAFMAATALEQAGMRVRVLPKLRADEAINPALCDVLVVAGPTAKMPDETVGKIRDYLAAGGSVLLMLDPVGGPDDGDKDPAAPLAGLLAEWGIQTEPWPEYNFPVGPSRVEQIKMQIPAVMQQNPMALRQLRENIRTKFTTLLWWMQYNDAASQHNPAATEGFKAYNTHPITAPLWQGLISTLPPPGMPEETQRSQRAAYPWRLEFNGARYVGTVPPEAGKTPTYHDTPLLWTPGQVEPPPMAYMMQQDQFSLSVWSESKAEGEVPLPLPDAGERRGPFAFAVIAERLEHNPAEPDKQPQVSPHGAKLLVIGDSGFIADSSGDPYEDPRPDVSTGANQQLWTRMISYLAGPPRETVEVNAKQLVRFEPLPDRLQHAQTGLLAALLVVTAALLGTMVWLVRRRA